MSETNWQKLNEIFTVAIEMDAEAQSEFLRQIADEKLRREAEQILAASRRADAQDFLSADAFAAGARVLAGSDKESAPAAEQIGKYKIIKEIGRGGMGAIYLAEREDFHYRVALKIIKRGMDTDAVVARFEREREVLAALNHPNIARLLDGGTTRDGLPYLVMEYIEGKQITAFCDENLLSIEERLGLFRKVCAAVSFAHQNLIVHRDLKPSNILVDRLGEPKLLDFGIAKLLAENDATQTITDTGMRLMTPEYASPEQIRGERVTAASDIYSLGVLLYELLSGRRPFQLKNHTSPEILKIVSEHDPPAPSTAGKIRTAKETDETVTPETIANLRRERPQNLRRRLSGDLDNITLKALRKEPDERFDSAEQFSEDIRRYLAGLPVTARRANAVYRAAKFVRRNRNAVMMAAFSAVLLLVTISSWFYFLRASNDKNNAALFSASNPATRPLAVLPFISPNSNFGASKATELTRLVSERLGKAGQIRVLPPESLTAERAVMENFLLAGQKLGAAMILTGRIFQFDEEKIYLRLHLVSVGDGEVLWANTYHAPRGDLPFLLDDIENNVRLGAQKLAAPEEYERRAAEFTANREAFQLYAQGRFLWKMRDDFPFNMAASVDYFERAIRLDPNFALPYLGIADYYKINSHQDARWRDGEQMARKALELAPGLADARAALGFIKMFHYRDFPAAEEEFRRALALDPDCLGARQWYALMLALQGRHAEAGQHIRRAQQIAPFSLNIRKDSMEIAYLARVYDDAIIISRSLKSDLNMTSEPAHAFWHTGEFEKAIEEYFEAGWMGDRENREKVVESFRRGGEKTFARYAVEHYSKGNKFENAYRLAQWHAALDERERALDFLERADDEHHFFIIYIKADPFFDNLRGEPRFQALLKRVGLSD